MGEGIFLLVIKDIFDDTHIKNKKKIGFKKNRTEKKTLIRYTDYINDKPFYILEIEKNHLNSERIQKLLSAYKGRIVLNENLALEPFEEYLFDGTDYFFRAVLSSLVNKIEFEKNIKSICIKYDRILVCEEVFELVKNVRNFYYAVEDNKQIEYFKNECFNRYGTWVNIGNVDSFESIDVYIDLSQLTADGKCEIDFKGKRGLLYPDCSFFDINDNVRKLLKYGVNRRIACAICEVKNDLTF